jgi:hypothetical protein
MKVDYGSMGGGRFFYIFWFFKKNREMNMFKTYFQVLTLLSHVSQVDVTYKGDTPVHMAQLTFT